ncbi:uncharacterized protein LOC126897669 [Daktulosphaira vitifoliae]|uniref:uncharacterized protein LOC126897669 n=1 Tax=Daktulosphaira vitifoliae TaxID=58002 RepID=UPI0021A99EAB|nr:uncharacterized protein LOC126897669 [Daktulosphaira vitifoliae]
MSRNNFDSTTSTFKAPLAPIRMPQSTQAPEALLFNDIMEDKTTILRNTMAEFLQVQPYRKFEFEFSNFLNRVKGMIEEGHRNGANASRLTNISHIAPMYNRPSMSFNCRPPSTMSMFPSNQSSYQISETNYQQRIQPLNPFKPPSSVSMLQPKLLSHNDDDMINHEHSCSPKSCTTIIEMGQQANNVTKRTCDDFESHEDHVPEKHQDTAINKYSDMTIIENGSFTENSNVNNSNRCKLLESDLENVGFKIVVGLPNKSTTLSKKDHSSRLDIVPQSQLNNISETLEKYLSKWSINVKEMKSQKKTKVAIVLSGTLLAQDKVTVLEKNHDAGILECRKEKNLIKTKNGLYRLLGNIISGYPKNVFTICLETGGIPLRWRILLCTHENVKRELKKPPLNFSLESPAGPMKLSKPALNLDVSMTRKGTSYGTSKVVVNKDISNKRKFPECDTAAENNKSKHRKYQAPLLASTPKRPRLHPQCATPSEILKSKLCRKLNVNHEMSKHKNCKTLNTANDSIVVKKRQSYTKDENIQFLRPPTPMTNNNANGSKSASSEKSANHTKSSRNGSVNSTNINSISCSKQSKSSLIENSGVHDVTDKINSSKAKHKTSVINSTASTLEHSKQIKTQNSILKKRSKSKNENIIDSKSKIILSDGGKSKITKRKPKEDSKRIYSKVLDEIPKNICTKEKKKGFSEETPTKSASGQGLFDNFEADDYGDISDFNVMQSPGKLSMISRTDKSRSETPPLFNQQWMGTSGKSIVISEPPTPLSKSAEAKALRRVKRPEITEKEELKEMKRYKLSKKKQGDKEKNYDAVNKLINDMLVYGEQLSFDDEMISYSS